MGCINSTKKLTETKNENVFRVRVVRLHPESPSIRAGFLELTPRELIYVMQGREPIVWALQHLRRYGLNGDIFSFEAGRRCMTGPGVYTFRCQNAELLYGMFERYVNASVTLIADEATALNDRDREHPSHALGRPENNSANVNNYLEPVAVAYSVRTNMHESFSSSPISLELDSPDSVPSFSFTNEVVHFQSHHQTTPGAYVNTNVYMEQPLRANTENNNNTGNGYCNNSAFSTLSRKTIAKRSSLDIPPEECAPILTPGTSTSLHMYANVEGLGISCSREREKAVDTSERCYENLSRLDLPLLLQPPPAISTLQRGKKAQEQAPTCAVNYIVLDLDQPRSPAQSSPKTYFGSGSLSLGGDSIAAASNSDVQSLHSVTTTTALTATTVAANCVQTSTKQEEHNAQQQQLKSESSLGYSTIDFIKTCALIKSSTHGADFDGDHDHDQEESRKTRHSKGVRKAYSISE
ncbi:uncharacterized protein LOC119690209 [Teleopsis dalmanni]|uniref:uncharacterized protein LOC119690209 n=1 Tax=Teleopsis dalmanni TaxID=139649 RepID=UPI0018CE97C1|nr:uncharacterized protein LOC119690209 [Teleopsis dalmanni]XP_037961150.1 uncharacterized protein LOC119690209 [Teleopsis dalmanni]